MATNVTMMKLRNEPGSVIDRVYYRNESFIVEKAGEPRAVIVPMREYQDMQQRKQAAKAKFWAMTLQLREALRGIDPEKIEQEIEMGLAEARAKRKRT